jgi:uncharacterized oxidoreductase
LITGGTSGIGLAFAEQFLQAGSRVIICGRRQDRLQQIKGKYPGIGTLCCDVSDAESRRSLYREVVRGHPETNVLLNNAGVQLVADLTREVDLSRIHDEIETNLVAPIHLASLFSPHLAGKENATIINISSGLAFVPIAFMPVYCATKAAIHSITLSLRHQLREKSVKVIEIIPPSVDTELGHERRADKSLTHGGMPVSEFIRGAMEALDQDLEEAPIGQAVGLRGKGEELFDRLNSHTP